MNTSSSSSSSGLRTAAVRGRRLRIVPEPAGEGRPRRPAREAPLSLLVSRARGGDLRAWTRLYEDHFDGLLRHTAYLTGDVAVAEDVVQDAFAAAIGSLGTLERAEAFPAWIRGIAGNLVRKHWRKQQRRARAYAKVEEAGRQIATIVATEPAPEKGVIRERRADALLAALDTLPPRLREAFVMSEFHGMAAAEAATELGITPGNFRVRAARARARLRAVFRRHGLLADQSGGDA